MADDTIYVDVSKLPFSRVIGEGDFEFDLADMFGTDAYPGPIRRTFEFMQSIGVLRSARINDDGIEEPVVSCGFAMFDPFDMTSMPEDTPEAHAWFVNGWGPRRDQAIANAVRKLRPLLRDLEPTMGIKHPGAFVSGYYSFSDEVPSVDEDGNFPWGDFLHGGSVLAMIDSSMHLVGAVSVYAEVEDCTAALTGLGIIGQELYRRVTLPRIAAEEAELASVD